MTSRADKIKELDGDVWVEIEHPTTHERYGVKMSTYREVYGAAGFEVDRYADGKPILADAKEPEVPESNPPLGVQGPEQPGADEPVTPQGETTETGE